MELSLYTAVYIWMALWKALYVLILTFEYKSTLHIHAPFQDSPNHRAETLESGL